MTFVPGAIRTVDGAYEGLVMCRLCRFYWPADRTCRRHPPLPVDRHSGVVGLFPPTDPETWCGEFRPLRPGPPAAGA